MYADHPACHHTPNEQLQGIPRPHLPATPGARTLTADMYAITRLALASPPALADAHASVRGVVHDGVHWDREHAHSDAVGSRHYERWPRARPVLGRVVVYKNMRESQGNSVEGAVRRNSTIPSSANIFSLTQQLCSRGNVQRTGTSCMGHGPLQRCQLRLCATQTRIHEPARSTVAQSPKTGSMPAHIPGLQDSSTNCTVRGRAGTQSSAGVA